MVRYLSIFVIFFVFICTVNCRSADKDSPIRLSQIKQYCEDPQESYPLRVVGIPFVLSVYEKCASHKRLLVVSWASEAEYQDLETKAAQLVVGAYARFKSNSEIKCAPNHLNIDISKEADANVITSFHTTSCNQRTSHPASN